VLARPASIDQLSELAGRCHQRGVPLRVLGKGANLLVREGTVPGVVVSLEAAFFREARIDGGEVTAGSGADLFKLVRQTARAGLAGLEQVAGIPASVGGAVRMNAGGAFGDIGSFVRRVTVMEQDGRVSTHEAAELVFGYRRSNISAPLILEATLALEPGEPSAVMQRVKEVFAYKKASQPMAEKSAGCAFKNPISQSELGAGALVERAGLKGTTIGGARISHRHANFVVTDRETGSAEDVYKLIEHVREQVARVHGIELEREVVVWP
jgi:UDP-N-acetylmuramate dehydrogenase